MSENQVTVKASDLPALPDAIRARLLQLGGNEDVQSGLNQGFRVPPTISIEGGFWSVVIDGKKTTMMKRNEDGDEEPISILNVAVVKANQGLYRLYYKSKYNPDAETADPPVCHSFDGKTPSPFAKEPQAQTCTECPHAVYGSAINDQGNKSFECSTNKLLAVIPYAAVKVGAKKGTLAGTIYRLKVSPTALSRNKEDRTAEPGNNVSLNEYARLLNEYPLQDGTKVAVAIRAVKTKLFFEPKAKYPLVRFKMGGFLSEEEIDYVQSRVDGEDVKEIVEEQGQAQPQPVKALTDEAGKAETLPAPKKPPVDEGDDVVLVSEPSNSGGANGKPDGEGPKKRGRAVSTAAKAEVKEAPKEIQDDMDTLLAGIK